MDKDLQHKIVFKPAWDRCDPNPDNDYGVRDVEIIFLVIGSEGIVEFQLLTGWHLQSVEDRSEKWALEHWWDYKAMSKRSRRLAFPVDVCYWSLTKISDDDLEMSGIEHVFSGAECFYNWRRPPAPEDAYQALVTKGDSGVWDYLTEYYHEVFEC